MNFTKQDLINLIAAENNMAVTQATEEVNRVFQGLNSLIHYEMKVDDTITLRTFGKFKKHLTKQKKGRNIKTGEKIIIPPAIKIGFKSYMKSADLAEAEKE